MLIGVVKEARAGETRVAATPVTVAQLLKLGYEVVVEPGAGEASSFPDAAYEDAGAGVGDALAADIVFGVNPPEAAQRQGQRHERSHRRERRVGCQRAVHQRDASVAVCVLNRDAVDAESRSLIQVCSVADLGRFMVASLRPLWAGLLGVPLWGDGLELVTR